MLALKKNTKLITHCTMCRFFFYMLPSLKLVYRSGGCNILRNFKYNTLPTLRAPRLLLITHAVFFPESMADTALIKPQLKLSKRRI